MQERRELLERLEAIARRQTRLLAANRLEEMEALMKERAGIISSIRSLGSKRAPGPQEKALIQGIVRIDADLRLSLEADLRDTMERLTRLRENKRAERAYTRDQAKRSGERCSRDG